MRKILYKSLNLPIPPARFSLRLYREYRLRQFKKSGERVLDIAGGSMPLNEAYLNVDIADVAEVDLVCNLLDCIPLDDASVEKVVSVATIEHFTLPDVQHIFSEFYRLLTPGGKVEIGLPSLKKILEQYTKRGCDDEVLRYLHGGLKDEYDVHYFVVDPTRMIDELRMIGFKEAHEEVYDYPRHSPDFMMKIIAIK